MRPKFLADADFNCKIISGFRRREPAADFVSAKEGGAIARPDPEVLRIAAVQGRILVSHDRKTMPGHFAGAAIEDLLLIWTASDAAEWKDTIGFVPI